MQNRYTGDIGDFGKLCLIRVLQLAGLSISVNWYLTSLLFTIYLAAASDYSPVLP